MNHMKFSRCYQRLKALPFDPQIMFIRIFLVDMYDLNIAFTVIKERKSGINFLQDELFLAAVEIYQTQSIL